MATYYYSGTVDLNQASINDGWIDGDIVVLTENSTGIISSTITPQINYSIYSNATLQVSPANTNDFIFINCSATYFFGYIGGDQTLDINGNLISLGNLSIPAGGTYPELDLSALNLPFIPVGLYVASDNMWYININHPNFDWSGIITTLLPADKIHAFYWDDVNKKAIFQYKQPSLSTSEILHSQVVLHHNWDTASTYYMNVAEYVNYINLTGVFIHQNYITGNYFKNIKTNIKDSILLNYFADGKDITVDNCLLFPQNSYTKAVKNCNITVSNSLWVGEIVPTYSNLNINNCILHAIDGVFLLGYSGQNLGDIFVSNSTIYGYVHTNEGFNITLDNCIVEDLELSASAYNLFKQSYSGNVKLLNTTFNYYHAPPYGGVIYASSGIDKYKFVINNVTVNLNQDGEPVILEGFDFNIRNLTINRNYTATSYSDCEFRGKLDLIKFTDVVGYSLSSYDEKVLRDVNTPSNSSSSSGVSFVENTNYYRFIIYFGIINLKNYVVDASPDIIYTGSRIGVPPSSYIVIKVPSSLGFKSIQELTTTYPLGLELSTDGVNWTTTLPFNPNDSEGLLNFYIKYTNTGTSTVYYYYFYFDFNPKTTYSYDMNYYANKLTLTGIKANSEVRIYDVTDPNNPIELFGIENTDGNDVVYNYNWSGDIPIEIVVFHLDYNPIRLQTTLTSQDNTIPIQQVADKWYNNP